MKELLEENRRYINRLDKELNKERSKIRSAILVLRKALEEEDETLVEDAINILEEKYD